MGSEYAKIVGISFLYGQMFSEVDIKNMGNPVVISDTVAKYIFNEVNILGKQIIMTGFDGKKKPSKIVGVFKDLSTGNLNQDQFLAHLLAPVPLESQNYGGAYINRLIAKSKPGQSVTAKAQIISAIQKFYTLNPSFNKAKRPVYTTKLNQDFGIQEYNDPSKYIYSLVGMITLIICSIGIFSIQMVSVAERRKEIGMRRTLGADQTSILSESLGESVVLAGLGSVVGFGLVVVFLPALGRYLTFSTVISITPLLFLEMFGAVLLSSVIFGFYPAFLASRVNLVSVLKES